MSTQSITLQIDEGEYEKLKEYLSEFGDPEILFEIAIRSYIRNLNTAMPLVQESNYNLKTYFRLLGAWLEQFDTMVDIDMFMKTMGSPGYLWQWINSPLFFDITKSKQNQSASSHQHQH